MVEARHQYLICTASTLHASRVPEDLHLAEPGTDRERAGLVAALNEAFGAPQATDAGAAPIRRTQDNGGVAVAALTDAECAGGGRAMPPGGGVSEVAGIGVRAAFRRRGLGGAITAEITRLILGRGAEIAWLGAGGEDSWRVYERVGYVPAGHRLYMSRAD